MERYLEILKVNFKHNLFKPLILIAGFFILAPFIMGMKNLNEVQTAKILEVYVSLFGIVFLVPLFTLDEDLSIRNLIKSKKESMLKLHFIRLLQQSVMLIGSILLFIFILREGNCSFDFFKLFVSVLCNCIFLGGLGILSYSMINSQPFAYMIPIFYYILSYGCGKDILGEFYLFSIMGRENNIYLSVAAIVMICVGIVYRDVLSFYRL